MKEKKLFFFSGSDWDRRGGRLYIAAHSLTDAARLLDLGRQTHRGIKNANPIDNLTLGRNTRWINQYFYRSEDGWRGTMKGKPIERSVWREPAGTNGIGDGKPMRII